MVEKAFVAALFAVLPSGGVAHADPADDQYLGLLASHGIQGDPGRLIAAGRQSCAALDLGRFGIGISPYSFEMLRITGGPDGPGTHFAAGVAACR